MESYIYNNSSDDDIFLCGQCKIVFTSLTLFLEHKKRPCAKVDITLPEKDINIVETVENDKKSLHFKCNQYTYAECSETNTVHCKTCQKSFKQLKALKVHLKVHSGERAYQCPVCGRCFMQNSHLQRHLQSHKVWPDGLSNTLPKQPSVDLLSYACPYCESIFSNYSQFRIHLKVHASLKKIKCVQGECINLFDNIEMLLQHVSIDHTHLVYQCHLCTVMFNSLEEIAIHQQNHKTPETALKNDKKFKCMYCDAIFKKKDTLSMHMYTENHKKTCIHCQKTFASDKRLRIHLQIHKKLKPFHCNICGLSFQMKKYLAAHILKHGERQHVCPICNFKFKRRDTLSRHIKCHQNSKKLQCPFRDKLGCKMEFNRSDKLKLHIKYHTNRMEPKMSQKQRNNTDKPVSTIEILIVPVTNKDN